MTILYSNGCSYTANKCLQDTDRYPNIVAKQFGLSVMDHAHPGSCNSRIIRCTMRDCITLLEQKLPMVALVQLTHPARTEYSNRKDNSWKQWRDAPFESIKPNETQLPDHTADYLKSHTMMFDHQSAMINLHRDLVGLTSFFKCHDIKYLIYNGPKDLMTFESSEFSDYLAQDPNVIDLKKFCMLDVTGKQDHPDEKGMRSIADYIIDRLQSQAPFV